MVLVWLVVNGAWGGALEAFVEDLPPGPSRLVGCSSADALQALSTRSLLGNPDLPMLGLGGDWLDATAPVWVAGWDTGRVEATVVELGVSDPQRLAAFLEAEPPGMVIEPGRSWATRGGEQLVVTVAGGRARFTSGDPDFPPRQAAVDILPAAVALDPSQPGCIVVTTVPPGPFPPALAPTALGFRTFVDEPDRMQVVGLGVRGSDELREALLGAPPFTAPIGTGEWTPKVHMRINGELTALLAGVASVTPAAPQIQDMILAFAQLEEHGVRIGSGVEFAGQGREPGSISVLVAPIERPGNARSLPKKLNRALAKAGVEAEMEDGVLVVPQWGHRWYLGATADHVVAGNQREAVEQVLEGRGTSWFGDVAYADEPGIVFSGKASPRMPVPADGPVAMRLWMDERGLAWCDIHISGAGAE